MIKIIFISFLGLFLFSAFQVSAAGLVPCGGQGEPACQLCHGFVLFKNLIDFIIILSFAIATLMLAVGGVMYAISAGNEGMLRQAKAILKSTVIGLIIMLTSWLLVGFVLQVMGVAGPAQINIDFGKWWQINCPVASTGGGIGGGGTGAPPRIINPVSSQQNPNLQSAGAIINNTVNEPPAFQGVNPPASGEEMPIAPF